MRNRLIFFELNTQDGAGLDEQNSSGPDLVWNIVADIVKESRGRCGRITVSSSNRDTGVYHLTFDNSQAADRFQERHSACGGFSVRSTSPPKGITFLDLPDGLVDDPLLFMALLGL